MELLLPLVHFSQGKLVFLEIIPCPRKLLLLEPDIVPDQRQLTLVFRDQALRMAFLKAQLRLLHSSPVERFVKVSNACLICVVLHRQVKELFLGFRKLPVHSSRFFFIGGNLCLLLLDFVPCVLIRHGKRADFFHQPLDILL